MYRKPIATFRRFLIALFVLSASASYGDELCADWEKQRRPELAIPESAFTEEAAGSALNRLQRLATAPSTQSSYFAEQQSLIFVEGWLLRKAAIAVTDGQASPNGAPELKRFCEFLLDKGYYYD